MDKQQKLREFVNKEVLICQTMLVEKLLECEIVPYDDMVNMQKTDEEMLKEYGTKEAVESAKENGEDEQEIFEWWVVSEWLLGKLEAQGEPVLHTDFGDWWGRGCTGQAILLDGVIEQVYDDTMK